MKASPRRVWTAINNVFIVGNALGFAGAVLGAVVTDSPGFFAASAVVNILVGLGLYFTPNPM